MKIKDSNEMKTSTKFKKAFIDVILSSTCHGIPNIFKSTRISLKIIWIAFSILSTAGCGFVIVMNIINYLKFEVITIIRVKNEFNTVFPAVTVCNINFFANQNASESLNQCQNSLTQPSIEYEFPEKFRSCLEKRGLMKDPKIYGKSKEELIVQSFFYNKYLSSDNFSYFYHPMYGNCYTFNSGLSDNGSSVELKRIFRNDRSDSLILILNFEIDDPLKEYVDEFGGIIFVHNQTTSPFSVNGIIVGGRLTTNIGLKRTFTQSEPMPYSECAKNTNRPDSHDSDLYKLTWAKFGHYTQALCIEQCFQKNLVLKCNCTYSLRPSVFDKEPCDIYEECYNENFPSFFRTKNIEQNCIPLCPLECEKQIIDTSVSVQTFANSSEYSVVYIFYDSLGYTEIKESPTTSIYDLISGIGGVAGLFLGMSFLSLIEVIEILLQFFFIFWDRNKVEQQAKNQEILS